MRPRIRIIVRTPEPPEPLAGTPLVWGVYPSWADARVVVVSPDGEEFDLPDVLGFRVECSAADQGPIEATIRIVPDEVEIECVAKVEE